MDDVPTDEFLLTEVPWFVVKLPRPTDEDELMRACVRLAMKPGANQPATTVCLFTDTDLADGFAAMHSGKHSPAEPLACENWIAFELMLRTLLRQGETHLVLDPDPEFRRPLSGQPIATVLEMLRHLEP